MLESRIPVIYRIAGNFRRANFHKLVESFCGKYFAKCSLVLPNNLTCPNLRKLSRNSHKTLKFMKVFSLKSLPLYGSAWSDGTAHSTSLLLLLYCLICSSLPATLSTPTYYSDELYLMRMCTYLITTMLTVPVSLPNMLLWFFLESRIVCKGR